MVEYVDSYFLTKYKEVVAKDTAKINSESPAWAIDRLSVLALKNLPHARKKLRDLLLQILTRKLARKN